MSIYRGSRARSTVSSTVSAFPLKYRSAVAWAWAAEERWMNPSARSICGRPDGGSDCHVMAPHERLWVGVAKVWPMLQRTAEPPNPAGADSAPEGAGSGFSSSCASWNSPSESESATSGEPAVVLPAANCASTAAHSALVTSRYSSGGDAAHIRDPSQNSRTVQKRTMGMQKKRTRMPEGCGCVGVWVCGCVCAGER